MMPQSTTSDSAMFPAQDTASSGSTFSPSDAVPLSADPGYYAKFSPALPPLDSHGAAMKVSVIGGHAELPIITPIHAATTLLQPHLHTTTLSSSPNRQDSANENDSGTDLFCRDSPPGLVSPPLPPPAAVLKPASVGHGHETENGAFRKKTRLIYDSGVRKFQQINHETVGGGGGEQQQHTVNGTDLRTSVIGEKPVLIASNTNRSSSTYFEE